jgi:hypothetical protein
MRRWVRRASVRLAPAMVLTALLGAAFGSHGAAQPATCELLAPWELTEATGAAFGEGEPTDASCTWRTETRAGHVLTITLDRTTQPPLVMIETDDPSIDVEAAAAALSALAADRIARGDTAPAEPPSTFVDSGRPDLCALFPADDVAAMLGVRVKPYGSMGESACGYIGDEPDRILVDVLVAFDEGSLADILGDWPEAVEVQVAGLPALDYGWDVGTARTSYLSVETGAGTLTALVTYDDTDLDTAAVARALVEDVLAAMGHAID